MAAPSEPCSTKLAEDTTFLNDPDNSLANIAKKIGMSERCQRITGLNTTENTGSGYVGGVGFGGGIFGAVGGVIQTTGSTLDRSLIEAGCGVFSVTANTILNSTRNISCILNNTSTNINISGVSNANITLNIGGDSIRALQNIITETQKTVSESLNTIANMRQGTDSDFAFKYRADILLTSITSMQTSLAELMSEVVDAGGIIDSTVTSAVSNTDTIKSGQTLSAVNLDDVKNDMKNIAGAVAFNKLSQVSGVDSLTSDSRTGLQQKISDSIDSQTNNIKNLTTGTKITRNDSGGITIDVAGRIKGATLTLNATTLTDMNVTQIVKSAIAIGNSTASSIVASLSSSGDTSTKTAGEEALIKEINDGIAKITKIEGENANKFFGSFFGMISNGFIIAAVIAVAGVFFIPIVVPSLANIFPPWLKTALIAVLVYLIVAWFISWPPFSKPTPDKRLNDMSIPDIFRGQGMRKSNNSTGLKKSERNSQFTIPYSSNFNSNFNK